MRCHRSLPYLDPAVVLLVDKDLLGLLAILAHASDLIVAQNIALRVQRLCVL